MSAALPPSSAASELLMLDPRTDPALAKCRTGVANSPRFSRAIQRHRSAQLLHVERRPEYRRRLPDDIRRAFSLELCLELLTELTIAIVDGGLSESLEAQRDPSHYIDVHSPNADRKTIRARTVVSVLSH